MIAEWFDTAAAWLEDVSSNWWFLLVIFVIAFLDSIFPIVPSETAVIIGGVAAGQGEQSLPLVILAGASGAFLGDNFAYMIGHRFRDRVQRWAARKEKRAKQLEGYGRQIHKRGGMLLITARFIPGGRTLLTLSCGITEQPRRWFVKWTAIAVMIWATYAATLGYVFGQAFKDEENLAFLLAFLTAISITVVIEIIRWIRDRRKKQPALT
jgi:membrane protein DedA with SNARE-associated domain